MWVVTELLHPVISLNHGEFKLSLVVCSGPDDSTENMAQVHISKSMQNMEYLLGRPNNS